MSLKKDHELNLAYLIYRLCGLLGNEDTSHFSHQNPVFKLALPDLIFAVVFITSQLQGLSILGNHRLPRWRNKELHWRITGAYYLLENWPNNFHEFLDWWRIQQRKFSPTFLRVKSVLHRDFGNFYAGLYKILLGSEYDFIRDAFVDYLAEEWEGCEIPTFSHNPSTTKYISKTDAKRLLDLDEPSIAYLIEIGRLRTIKLSKGKRGLIFVDVFDVAKLIREPSRLDMHH